MPPRLIPERVQTPSEHSMRWAKRHPEKFKDILEPRDWLGCL